MESDWNEIKRLAADFQKAQSASTQQRLSERNWVEIVTLLLERKLLNVLFTNDGKEYITHEHLEREILDELYINGGRVNLVEVSKSLNVDLTKIEEIAHRIAKENDDIYFMLGQLINEEYVTNIAQEINEKLSQKGEISISDLTLHFDLPSDFLQHNCVEKYLGKIIRGRQDPSNPRIFFTQVYIQRCKAKIRGALAAITRPTNVAAILQQINIQDTIFHSLLDETSPPGQITSKLPNAQYIPHIYATMQTDWVTSFYRQNGFLEYEAISKLGIADVKQYIRKQFPNESLMFLRRCAVGSKIIDLTVLAALNECSSSMSYVDLSTLLPSNMSEEDIKEIFDTLMKRNYSSSNSLMYLDGVVFSRQYLNNLIAPCHKFATQTALAAIGSGIYQQYLVDKQLASKGVSMPDFEDDFKLDKREERRKKAASGKSGGGSQGRETKTKSVKSKFQRGGTSRNAPLLESDDDDDDIHRGSGSNKKSPRRLNLVSYSDIVRIVNRTLAEEGLQDLSEAISELYYDQINQSALIEAQRLYEDSPQNNRRQAHDSLQDKINTLLIDIRLYEKGIKCFPTTLQDQLVKYLLKTLGNDICNDVTGYIASECDLNIKDTKFNAEQRMKVAQDCHAEYKAALIKLNNNMNKTIEDFVIAIETIVKVCGMVIRKVDKKKERQIVLQHKEKLCAQLENTTDPALLLHLTSLILFTTVTGCIVLASGKFVSAILSLLRPHLQDDQNKDLERYHDLVLETWQVNAESNEKAAANEELLNLQANIMRLSQIQVDKSSKMNKLNQPSE